MTPLFDRLDTIILRVRHLDAALDWYRRVLGLAVVFEDPEDELAVLGLGHGTSITLYTLSAEEQPAPPTAAGPFPIFATQNAGAAYSILLERGARVDPIQEGGGVRFFSFYDPDGNRLEACEILDDDSGGSPGA